MKKLLNRGFRFIVALSFLTATHSSYALTTGTVLSTDFVNGQTTYSTTFSDGTIANFVGSRSFEKKTQDGMTGVGISGGRTAGEIDIDETLTGSFSRQSLFQHSQSGCCSMALNIVMSTKSQRCW